MKAGRNDLSQNPFTAAKEPLRTKILLHTVFWERKQERSSNDTTSQLDLKSPEKRAKKTLETDAFRITWPSHLTSPTRKIRESSGDPYDLWGLAWFRGAEVLHADGTLEQLDLSIMGKPIDPIGNLPYTLNIWGWILGWAEHECWRWKFLFVSNRN